jgi:tripartite-type tricarboxylate transporter receptor subunit TctC
MNPALQKVGYDPVTDFASIGLVGSSPTLMVGHPDRGPADVATLIAKLKDSPRRFGYASAGDGTPPHFAAELFQPSTDTAMASASYEGAAPAIAETVAGRAQIMFPSLFTAHPLIRAGQLRALALTGAKRLAGLPGVPTLAELGVTGVDMAQWYGLFAPSGTPGEVIDKLNRCLNEVLTARDVLERFQSHGAQVEPGTTDALSTKVKAELARWSKVVKLARLAPGESRLATLD